MRALTPLGLILSAAIPLIGCSDTSGPEPPPSEVLVLAVAPSNATISGGRTFNLTALLVHADGRVTTPPSVSWQSTEPNIATVQSGGLVQGRNEGETRIIATWGSTRGSARVRVVSGGGKVPDETPCLKRIQRQDKSLLPTPSGC